MTRLEQINKEAALSISRALSKLTDRDVEVSITKAEEKTVEEFSPIIDPEEMVAGIYLPITGPLEGGALLILPKETAFTLSDLLIKRELGTTRMLTELDESALKEVGNIITANYLTVLSNTLEVKIIEHMPHFSFDMFGAIINHITATFAQDHGEMLVIEMEFYFLSKTFKGYFLLLFSLEKFEAVAGGGLKD